MVEEKNSPLIPVDVLSEQEEIQARESLDTLVAVRDQRKEVTGHSTAYIPKNLTQLPLWRPNSSTVQKTYTLDYSPKGTPPNHKKYILTHNSYDVKSSEGGLLRYSDLDLTIVLGAIALEKDRRYFTYDQREILHWMGFSKREIGHPSKKIKAALLRLTNTRCHYWTGPQNININKPEELDANDDITSFNILSSGKLLKDSNYLRLQVGLSDAWLNSLVANDWHQFSADIYAYLAREKRRVGLIRLLYIYLYGWREKNAYGTTSRFNCPLGPCLARHAPRRLDGSFTHTRMTNANHPVTKALAYLNEKGVIRSKMIKEKDHLRIVGEFCYPDHIPRLSLTPRQTMIMTDYEKTSYTNEEMDAIIAVMPNNFDLNHEAAHAQIEVNERKKEAAKKKKAPKRGTQKAKKSLS